MKGTAYAEVFQKLAEWLDGQLSKAVLGQTMTTDDGSSQSQATVHDGVRSEIKRDDARQLAATLNRDLIRPFVDLNFGPQEHYPLLQFPALDEEDRASFVSAVKDMIDRGLKVSARQIRARLNLDAPEDDDDVLHPANVQSPDLPEQTEPPAKALNRAQSPSLATNNDPGSDLLDELEQTELEGWREIIEPLTDPIRDLINTSTSPEQVFEGLSKLAGEMDSEAFATALATAMFKARGAGDAGA
jgi:phage gp29-like protein